MKKAISGVLLFQAVCFVSMIFGHFAGSRQITATAFGLDMVGMILCPMALAVVGGLSGIRDNVSVLKAFPSMAATMGGIGLARGILFFAVSKWAGFAGAMKYLLISFVLLTIWTLIFELTRFLMNKETKYNRTKKK